MTEEYSGNELSPEIAHILVERLLDWPFLLFLLLVYILFAARSQLFDLLSTRQVKVKIGGNEVTIGEAINDLNNETSITAADLEALQTQIDALKPKTEDATGDVGDMEDKSAEVSSDLAISIMRSGLTDSRFTWRSIERLALEAGLSESEAHRLLAAEPDITISKGKSGRIIARLSR